MKIFNTLTMRKEEFVPLEPGKVKVYACGPTVYNFIHIGNARPICVFDVLRRYLEYRGYEVTFNQNFTDIDDKLIRSANEEGCTVPQLAARYIAEYETDAKGLGVREATAHPKATENIDTIIDIVRGLEEKGFAYSVEGDVYFRARKFEGYGKLSHQPLDALEAGSRVDVSGRKEDPLDFALWKAAKPGEPSYPSPWGEGRPGWHIECTAMILKYLGETIDIHCGGQDLIFPHHENEIAQAECYTGREYVRYWMHNGYINVDNHKMSKSLGNFFTTREVAQKFGYEPIKYMMLQAHYRSPINYSYDIVVQCKASLERLYNCRGNMDFALRSAAPGAQDAAFAEKLLARKGQFIAAMEDDLNTADAISALFELARDVNTHLTTPRAKADIEAAAALFDELCGVLGLLYGHGGEPDVDGEVELLIEQRQAARKAKDFAESDRIRDVLKAQGIVLEDTPQGVKWKRAQ